MYKIKKGAKTNYKRSKIERKTKTKYNKLKLTSDPVERARETPTLRNSEKDKTALKTPMLLRRSPNSNSTKLKGRSLIRVQFTCTVVNPVKKQEWLTA